MKKIKNIGQYVREQIIKSDSIIYKASKTATVTAVQGKLGEHITTVMKDGHKETDNIVKKDRLTGQLDWIITNPDGERYVMPDAIFKQKYKLITKNIYKRKRNNVIVLQIKENISFITCWGKEMKIKKNGFLVISSSRDIYGIQEKEFYNTYKIKNVINKEKVRDELLFYHYPELCDIEILTMKEKLKRIMYGQKIEGNIREK